MHEEVWASSRQTALRMRAYDGAEGDPAVVVLHGLGVAVDVLAEARDDLDPFAALREEGCHVLALDWPGHGRSGGRRGHLTYRMAMDACAEAVGVAQRRWAAPVAVLGDGMGGPLAFYAALEDDRVAAVACAGLVDLRDLRPVLLRRTRRALSLPLIAWLSRVLPAGAQRRVPIPVRALLAGRELADDPALASALRAHAQSVGGYSVAGLASILCSPEGKPDALAQRAPVLAAVGDRDTVVPETGTRALALRLSCPSEVWVLPGAGHQLLLEHPRAFLPAVAAFVRRQAMRREAS